MRGRELSGLGGTGSGADLRVACRCRQAAHSEDVRGCRPVPLRPVPVTRPEDNAAAEDPRGGTQPAARRQPAGVSAGKSALSVTARQASNPARRVSSLEVATV
ncbi:hypothetical protein GCM10027570_32540 [Streptomonospora sediminis]